MFNSIFRKQIIQYIGTLAISFGLLAVMLSQVINSYFTDQRINILLDSCKKMVTAFDQSYRYGFINPIGIRSFSQWSTEAKILQEYMNASFMIVDENAVVVIASDDIKESVLNRKLELDEFGRIMDGETVTIKGNLSDIYPEQVLTVGYPITVDEQTIGVILMNSSMPELENTISDMYRTVVLYLLATGGATFLLIYMSSKSISKPLQQMNDAAKIIASGDFEKRLDVHTKDEVGQLAQSFNNMAESLDQQEKMRREFIANISHDLRSPITSMKGFLQAIADGTVPSEKQNYYINIVLEESERLSKIANDILDLSKIQTMNLNLDRTDFDINSLIRIVTRKFEARILDKHIKITLSFADESNIVNADYEIIQRVVFNLLDNAVKFISDGGEINIETTVKDDKVSVSVADNGPGINPEDQKRIFDRFFKADESRGMDKKGSGLGLSIVREFIKAHGETITLISEPGSGCRFMFDLPLIVKEQEDD